MIARVLFFLFAFSVLQGCAEDEVLTVPHRVIAIGDIHADLGAARAAFQLAGAANDKDEWIGEDLTVVQLGDIIGRSYEDREVVEYILGMQEKAAAAGGRVYVLLGNHEVFGARLRVDYVPDEAYLAFEDIPGLDVEDPRLDHLPTDHRARGAAFISGGHYAVKFSEFPAVLRLGSTIYVHGGVTPHWAEYGIDLINEEFSQWFSGAIDEPASAIGVDTGSPDDIVVMSRHFSDDVSDQDCSMLEESLEILGAARMIVAHSVQNSITARCEGKVWAVDTGMSRFYGGRVQVLEIIDDEEISIVGN
ncbi:MAG: metallophosphoesterase [Woeseiaceae bacterium]